MDGSGFNEVGKNHLASVGESASDLALTFIFICSSWLPAEHGHLTALTKEPGHLKWSVSPDWEGPSSLGKTHSWRTTDGLWGRPDPALQAMSASL